MFARETITDKLIHETQALVQHAEDPVAANTSDAIAEARSPLHAARKSMNKIEHHVAAQAKHIAHETDDYVYEKPGLAIGAAASTGVLVGLLLARR